MKLSKVQVKKIVTWVVSQGLSSNQAVEDFDVCQHRI